MVGNLLAEIQPREPAVGQMHPHFVHQAPLAGDSIEIAYQQQAQQYLGINRGSSGRAVKVLQPLPYEAEIHIAIDQP